MSSTKRSHRSIISTRTVWVVALCGALLLQVQCTVGEPTEQEVPEWERGDYSSTTYPVLLVHGLSGFDSVGGLVDYFHRVPYSLERSGARVYVAQVSAFNDSEERGEQLADFITENVTEDKVNILAHSQGSPTARVAASFVPERIASITSISGANKGSRFADVVRGIVPPDGIVEGGVETLANAFASLLDLLTSGGQPQDAIDALETLTSVGAADVNSRHPWGVDVDNECGAPGMDTDVLGHDIKMFSWVGTDTFTNIFDVTDPFLVTTGLAFAGEPNDGLVGQCSQYLGEVVWDSQAMNHVDAINHLFGVHSLWVEPLTLYRLHVNRLKNLGL